MTARALVLLVAALFYAHPALTQSRTGPITGTLEVSQDARGDPVLAAQQAKEAALREMRKLGGQAAIRANLLQALRPHKFLERLAVSPVIGPSTIGAPKAGSKTPSPSVNTSDGRGATTAHAGVALLLARNGGENNFNLRCTGTLIRQNVILTAAHCMCWWKNSDLNYPTGKTCINGGGARGPSSLLKPDAWRVFFQHVTARKVAQVIVDEDYQFTDGSVRNDLALLVLQEAVTDIEPPSLPLSANPASAWQKGEVIGYGFSSVPDMNALILEQLVRPGMKGKGEVTSARCDSEPYLDAAASLCSVYAPGSGGSSTATCEGDSGGPLRQFDESGTTIGVTSGRNDENCAAKNTLAFQMATSYAAHHKWLEAKLEKVGGPTVKGRWPAFGDNLIGVLDRRNSVPFDEAGTYLSEGWMKVEKASTVLATINSPGAIREFSVQDRMGKTLCNGVGGLGHHMPTVDYCSATVGAGVLFRIVAKGLPNEYLQYVVTWR